MSSPALEPFDITLRDLRVRYVEGGPRDAPAVVLLHGLGRDHAQWWQLASALSAFRRVVALDLPGFGASEPLRGATTWEALTDAVLDVVAGLELGRATWIGHSVGGAAAIVAAADRPEFVERVVLVTPVCYRLPLAFEDRAVQAPVVGRSVGRRLFGARVLGRHVGSTPPAASLGLTFRLLEASVAPSTIEARVSRVRAPALVLWGREDPVSPWTHGTRLARELANARLEILDCGHFPESERASHVEALVRDFLLSPAPIR
jgi:pimeloyl-ACP methyl ester carboxylesterase